MQVIYSNELFAGACLTSGFHRIFTAPIVNIYPWVVKRPRYISALIDFAERLNADGLISGKTFFASALKAPMRVSALANSLCHLNCKGRNEANREMKKLVAMFRDRIIRGQQERRERSLITVQVFGQKPSSHFIIEAVDLE
ncbi:hypothetical protein ACOME3_006233 [Neoechinorhynchus agilis]